MSGHDDGQPGWTPLLVGPVLVVGAGLIGTSIGLALTRRHLDVYLVDVEPTAAHVAASRGAGREGLPAVTPDLVVVATPPEQLGDEVAAALVSYPRAVVTDVGSVKARPLEQLRHAGADLSRYVGSHPMAGGERSGPLAADANLFEGRAWAIVSREDCRPEAVRMVEELAARCGAEPVHLDADAHDLAVARVSHLPHVLAALTAGRLAEASPDELALSGQGIRDVTRVAAGDPILWRQIVAANAAALTTLLAQVRGDLDAMLAALASGDESTVERLLKAGVAGTEAIPGKHGGPSMDLVALTVAVPDRPGALAHLFAVADQAGVNIEDMRIDHDPARAYGLVELDVSESAAEALLAVLHAQGWVAHR